MKRIAISQSNYIPWKGYFDLIKAVDEFVLYDEVQFTKNDWRNRNRIMTAAGPKWMTIPVATSAQFGQRIMDVRVADQRWRTQHWHSWQAHYGRAAFFADYSGPLSALYLGTTEVYLSQINLSFIRTICGWLDIRTPISSSQEHTHDSADPSLRLLQICQAAGATHYLSGPAARDYLNVDLFHRAGIVVEWMNYDDYPVYQQLPGPFVHHVSALDLILNEGPRSATFLKPVKACIAQTTVPTDAL